MKPCFSKSAGLACAGLVMAMIATHAADPTSVQSASALQAVNAELGTAGSAIIYYTPGEDGYHVVATVQSAEPEPQVIRFTATLTAGQTAEISTPRGLGQPAAVIRIVRDGDQLRIEKPAG
jgi:hypothetical protein